MNTLLSGRMKAVTTAGKACATPHISMSCHQPSHPSRRITT
jgi:hypothetical protein